MKTKYLFVVLYLFLSAQSFAEEKHISLEKLQADEDFESGCGCSVANSKDETLIFSELQEKAPAIVRISGQKKVLKWMSTTEKSGSPKKGDAFIRVYGNGSAKLKLNYKTTFVCGKSDESCEVTRYSVNTTLEDGKKKSEMKNLKGDCGC